MAPRWDAAPPHTANADAPNSFLMGCSHLTPALDPAGKTIFFHKSSFTSQGGSCNQLPASVLLSSVPFLFTVPALVKPVLVILHLTCHLHHSEEHWCRYHTLGGYEGESKGSEFKFLPKIPWYLVFPSGSH